MVFKTIWIVALLMMVALCACRTTSPPPEVVSASGDVVETPMVKAVVEEPVNEPGVIREEIKDGMAVVPGGWFKRGSMGTGRREEEPMKDVYVDGFSMDVYEVTVDQYKACIAAKKCDVPETEYYNYEEPGHGKHPINGVNWHQAVMYCKAQGKRLPTEAEWEKAARGTDGRKFPWGDEEPSCERAVMNPEGLLEEGGEGCRTLKTWEVGSKPLGKSPYGIHDMAGSLWEWTADWYSKDYYREAPDRNPVGPENGEERVTRGGSWRTDYLSSSYRSIGDPDLGGSDTGIRCVK